MKKIIGIMVIVFSILIVSSNFTNAYFEPAPEGKEFMDKGKKVDGYALDAYWNGDRTVFYILCDPAQTCCFEVASDGSGVDVGLLPSPPPPSGSEATHGLPVQNSSSN